ncbi:MAG: dipeptidase [bacterium]
MSLTILRSAAARLRSLLPLLAAGLVLTACGGMSEEELQAEADRIHEQALVIDTHIDAPGAHVRDSDWVAADLHRLDDEGRPGQWDIPRMIEGGMDAVFLVVYTGQRELTPENYRNAYETAIRLFDWCETQAESSPVAEIALSTDDIRRLHSEGKRALLIAVENGFPIATDLSRVEEFYDRGMRYMTLTHSSDNQIGASSTESTEREDFGLTDFGREVVREMNRLGAIVDLSHVSDQTFYDVLEMTDVPVVLTHSGLRAIASSARNITDEMLEALAENGGVIQLVALGSYLRDRPENPELEAALQALREEFGDMEAHTEAEQAEFRRRYQEIRREYPTPPVTIDDFMNHLEHAIALAGWDHVGFGSDFDGGGGIQGLEDASDLPAVTVEMLRRGYTEEQIEKFWGGNFMRVFEAVETAAENRDDRD